MRRTSTPFTWLSLMFGFLGLFAGLVLGLFWTRNAESGEYPSHYKAVYREFYEFSRPDDSMLVGFMMCRPGGCEDWQISALYVTDQSAKDLCEYYLKEMEARNWTRRVDPGCDRLSPDAYDMAGDLPANEEGVVVRVQIRPTAYQTEIIPSRFYFDAKRLEKQIFSVRWSISCGQAACP